jgi:hypothetical protein
VIEVVIVALPDAADDEEQTVEWTGRLLRQLTEELDGGTVGYVERPPEPGSKGIWQEAGRLLAKLPGGELLRSLIASVTDFVNRTGREVQIDVDGKSLRVTRASPEEQRLLIDAYVAAIGDDRSVTP